MVDLPLEIIHNIITISLPEFDENNRDREQFLLPLCHLHSSLRRFTQRLLFSRVTLDTSASFAPFLDTVEGQTATFDFGSCVQYLRMSRSWDMGRQINPILVRIVDCCREIRTVSLERLDDINLALLAKLSNLHSLTCTDGADTTFEPAVEGESPLASVVNLVIKDGTVTSLLRDSLLTAANLPSLRLFSADYVVCDDDRLTFPSLLFAANLHHFGMSQAALTLLPATRQLRSLDHDTADDKLSFPPGHRFESALIALRLYTSQSWDQQEESLQNAVEAGLINGETVVIFSRLDEDGDTSADAQAWCDLHGIKAEFADGELERSWFRDQDEDEFEYSSFTRWVDQIAEERIVAARKK